MLYNGIIQGEPLVAKACHWIWFPMSLSLVADERQGRQTAQPPDSAGAQHLLVKGGRVQGHGDGGEGGGREVADGGAQLDRQVLAVQLAHLDRRQDHSQGHHLHRPQGDYQLSYIEKA